MADTVYVEMTAEQLVYISKFVRMDSEDWNEYVRLTNSSLPSREVDEAIRVIADKYDLGTESPHDWGDLDEVEFELADEPSHVI